jgi:hypothetical protein
MSESDRMMTERMRNDVRVRYGLAAIGEDNEAETERPPTDMNTLIRRAAGRASAVTSDEEDES